tara:strand:- start:203 stop:1141 length:939 start_codon:yes stop_codon:yes gene_type:complete
MRDDRIQSLRKKFHSSNHKSLNQTAYKEEGSTEKVKKKNGDLFFFSKSTLENKIDLKDQFLGLPIFLILSGPSLVKNKKVSQSLEDIKSLGAFSLGVNNSWSIFKPTFWTCADGPNKFLSSGWLDPRIIKFVPKGKEDQKIRKKENGKFIDTPIRTRDCPNVLFYPRNTDFDSEFFLTEGSVNWGQTSKRPCSVGYRGSRSVMLSAIRLCYHLGFRSIYLLGCDFQMKRGQQNYAFKQERSKSSVNGNNRTYDILNDRFDALKPIFEKKALSVYNCNPESGLKSFPYADPLQGIEQFKKFIPPKEDTYGWYD